MEIGDAGSLPAPAGYRLNNDGTGASPRFVEAVLAELGVRGFREAEDAGHPDYFVQIAGSDLPGKTGLFLPDAPPGEDGERQWLSSPTNRRSVRTRWLVLSITEISSGREVYRIYGSAHYRSGQAGNDERLTDAILAQLPPS